MVAQQHEASNSLMFLMMILRREEKMATIGDSPLRDKSKIMDGLNIYQIIRSALPGTQNNGACEIILS